MFLCSRRAWWTDGNPIGRMRFLHLWRTCPSDVWTMGSSDVSANTAEWPERSDDLNLKNKPLCCDSLADVFVLNTRFSVLLACLDSPAELAEVSQEMWRMWIYSDYDYYNECDQHTQIQWIILCVVQPLLNTAFTPTKLTKLWQKYIKMQLFWIYLVIPKCLFGSRKVIFVSVFWSIDLWLQSVSSRSAHRISSL